MADKYNKYVNADSNENAGDTSTSTTTTTPTDAPADVAGNDTVTPVVPTNTDNEQVETPPSPPAEN
jgi:hypothetical protein